MERVQLNLERLLPELRDLEKKKIFTRVSQDHLDNSNLQMSRHANNLPTSERNR